MVLIVNKQILFEGVHLVVALFFAENIFIANFTKKAFTKFGINFTSFAILLLFLSCLIFFSVKLVFKKFFTLTI